MAIPQLFCSAGTPRKRDSCWSWFVCACATMIWVTTLGFVFSFGVFQPVLMDYFRASEETAASVGSVGIALTFFTGHFSTALVTCLGCRSAALIGGEICAISLLLSSFANDILLLLFSYSILFGFGCSCLFSAGMIVINQYFSKRQSIAAGVLSAGIGVGVLIMGPALEALTRATDWKTAFLVMAGVIFFVSLFAITFDSNVEEDQETATCEEKEVEQDSGETKHGSIISEIKRALDVSIWKEPLVIALYLPEFFAAFGHFVPQIHLVSYCEELGISSQDAARLFIYRGVCSSAGRLLAGFLCNHPEVDVFNVYQASAFAAGLSAILMTVSPTFTSLMACNILYGLGDGCFYTCVSCLDLTVSPLKTAAVIGWQMMVESIFAATGPPLAASVGSVSIALSFLAGLFSTTLVTLLGCRAAAFIGAEICVISLLISTFVKDILLLPLTYSVLFGFGCSCIFSTGLIVINQYFSKWQSIAVGVINAGIGVGVLIMGPTLEALTRNTDWQTAFRVMAGVIFFVSLFAMTFDPNVEEDQETTNCKEKEVEQDSEETKHGSITSKIKRVLDVSIWKEPPVVAFFIPTFLMVFDHYVPQIYLVTYCKELAISSQDAATLFIFRGVSSSVGRLLAGFLCNHPRVDTFNVFQGSEFAAGLSTILMTVAPTFTSLIACYTLYGLGDGFFFTCQKCLLLNVSPLKTAAVIGWQMMVGAMFAASGAPLAGLLADKLGSYVVPFRVAGGITVVGAFIPFMLLCYKSSSQPTDLSRREDENQKLLK